MAVPKKRTGKSAQAKRRASWKATLPATTICKECGQVILTHTVCTECGTYKGKVVSIKNAPAAPAAAEEEKEVKKAKKSSKKADDKTVEAKDTENVSEVNAEDKPKRTKKSSKKADDADATEE